MMSSSTITERPLDTFSALARLKDEQTIPLHFHLSPDFLLQPLQAASSLGERLRSADIDMAFVDVS